MFFSEVFGIVSTFYFIYVTIIQFGGLDILSYFMAISSDLFIMIWVSKLEMNSFIKFFKDWGNEFINFNYFI